MQVAKLAQDYYGFVRQPIAPNKQVEAEQAESKRSRPTVLPAERLVEGELLRSRSNRAGKPVGDRPQRERFSNNSANSQDGGVNAQTAQRAINAYLDYAALPKLSNAGQPRTVDYYV